MNTNTNTALASRLRDACTSVRTRSYPLSDLIPLMQQAADALSAAALPPSIDELCARIKAADDEASKNDYMLDSDDCIKVLRGTWGEEPAAPKPHVHIPQENVHEQSDVSKKAGEVDTSIKSSCSKSSMNCAAAPKATKAEPVQTESVWLFKHEDRWLHFVNEKHRTATLESGEWECAEFVKAERVQPEPRIEWIDRWQAKHSVSLAGAKKHLQEFLDEWPGGFEEIESALKMKELHSESVQPERVPLTDRQISDAYFEALGAQHLREQDRKMVTRFARAIEQAHGIQPAHKEQPNGKD